MYEIGINIGFITNSSSCVYHFPVEILNDPEVKEVFERYGLDKKGYVGPNFWSRSLCESVAVTDEDFRLLAEKAENFPYEEYSPSIPSLRVKGFFTVVFGDEYGSFASELAQLLVSVSKRMGLNYSSMQYN